MKKLLTVAIALLVVMLAGTTTPASAACRGSDCTYGERIQGDGWFCFLDVVCDGMSTSTSATCRPGVN